MRASTHVYTQYCSYLFKFNGQISQVPDFSLRFNDSNLIVNRLIERQLWAKQKGRINVWRRKDKIEQLKSEEEKRSNN